MLLLLNCLLVVLASHQKPVNIVRDFKQSLLKRPQASRNPGTKISVRVYSSHATLDSTGVMRVKIACLLCDANVAYSRVFFCHGPIRQQLESMWDMRGNSVGLLKHCYSRNSSRTPTSEKILVL
jgi:hypothetical protein